MGSKESPEQYKFNFEGGEKKEETPAHELTHEEMVLAEIERMRNEASGRYKHASDEGVREIAELRVRQHESGKATMHLDGDHRPSRN